MITRPSRNTLIVSAALLFGLGAAWLATHYLDERAADLESRNRQRLALAVVAKTNLAPGSTLDHGSVAVREIPAQWLHSGAITPDQFDRAAGSVLAHPAAAGEPLLWAHIEGRQAASLSARVESGRRAATVPVDDISSLAGMLEAGDLIDLILTVQRERENLSVPLLQAVTVLATGQRTRPGGADGREREFDTITLDLSPEQAARLTAARSVGKLTAILRAPADRASAAAPGGDAMTLLGLMPPPTLRIPVIYGGSHNLLLDLANAQADAAVDPRASIGLREPSLPALKTQP